MIRFGGEFRMSQEAQRVEPMVESDDDDPTRGEKRAVVTRFGSQRTVA